MRTLTGTFTDISRSGCYAEVQATFPPGTKVYLSTAALWVSPRRQGCGYESLTRIGMGLEFTEMTEDKHGQGGAHAQHAGRRSAAKPEPAKMKPGDSEWNDPRLPTRWRRSMQ